MSQDDKPKHDVVSKHRRSASLGGRTAQFIAVTGHRYTQEEARDALQKRLKGEQQGKALPIGTLRKWHWRAMGTAWKARPQGVTASGGWYGDYGKIVWKVWVRLRDYQDGALIETYERKRERRAGIYTPLVYWLRLTPFGEQYYQEHWQRYHDLYPDVDAPAPHELIEKTEEPIQISSKGSTDE